MAHVKRDYCRELASKRLISTLMTDNQQHGLTARDEQSRMDAGHDFQSWDEKFDDLHIDRIDENWKERANWVSASIRAYELAVRLQRSLGLTVKVALAFSLLDGMGQTFETEEEFESQLDGSPPSLYLFEAADQQHLSNVVGFNPIPKTLASRFPRGTKSFLLQWATEDGSVRRSVIVES